MNLNVIFPLDANADGLPDAWEAAYGITDPNADSDSDGQANWQEYYAGTNPTNAASVFRILSLSVNSNGSRVLTWASTGGTRYRVQFADADPNQGLPGTFTDVTRLISDEMDPGPEGAPSTQAFTDDFNQTGGAPPNSARYYRVQVIR